MTLADEDTNSILTDNVNRAIEGNVAMQVWWLTLQSVQIAPSGDQIVQTMDEASHSGQIFYLQMEGGAI